MSKKYIITSALPYVHGIIHIGNIFGSIVPADIHGKFLKLKGEKCLVICGSDMHGSPGELAALKKGISPREYMLKQHEITKEIINKLYCTFDNYSHTDTETNREIVTLIFKKLYENGYIGEQEIILPYCKKCNKYLPDRFIEGKCPKCGGLARGDQCDDCGLILDPQEIVDPYCVLCGSKEIEFRKVKNLVFEIPKLKKELEEYYNTYNIYWSKLAKSESKKFLEDLRPRPISRFLSYGFKIPLEGYEDQVFYVWFDAPIGYISITAEIVDWKEWWLDKNTTIVHYIGKDNIYFHAIFWPAILIGTKLGFSLPKIIAASGFLMAKDVKFSKSRGIGLNCLNYFEYFEDPDFIRYYIAKHWSGSSDASFSLDKFMEDINKELIGNIANYILRTVKLTIKKLDGIFEDPEPNFKKEIDNICAEIEKAYYSFIQLNKVVELINKLAHKGNQYLNKTEPWKKEKPIKELSNANYVVKKLIFYLYPICPRGMRYVLTIYGDTFKDLEYSKKYLKKEIGTIYKQITKSQLEKIKEVLST